ncbi:alternative ribosome rescue aminoacyl-tRNA hydrolase ArfB [Candidatus Dependentiae bacterium]
MNEIHIKNDIAIPYHELEITTSRSGGPGGQHVNKTETRITVRWNVKETSAFPEPLKERVLENLESRLTADGYLIIHNSESRSQLQNKKNALENLAAIVRKALFVPKKRIKTKIPKKEKEKRLRDKKRRGDIKKRRRKNLDE